MAKYLQCTMSAPVDFEIRKDVKNSPVAQVTKVIRVAGGANVRDRKSIYTPNGLMTEVSDEDYALLEQDQLFRQLKANGYIVVTSDHHLNVNDNEKKDKSAPKTPEDFQKERKGSENPVPVVGAIAGEE